MKIFYRFNYNWNHSVSNEDAPTDITVEHLEQLEPFFSENADIIAWMEMGFIGYWGEMHTSTSGHIVEKTVGLSDSGKKILYKALDVFPADRVIGVRYPQIIFRDPNEYGSLGFQTPLNEDNAYDGTYQSRLAGWYANFGAGEKLWHEDQEYATQWAPSTEFVPQWAHCDHFQDLTMDSYEWLDDAKKFHYVALSNPQDENHTYDIYERWVQDGVYDDYEKYLGYRYELVSSRLNAEVAPGEQLTVSLTVANQGWARPVNPRRVEVILRHPTTGEVWALEVTPSTDFRLWFPGAGQEKELAISLSVPDDTPAGAYEVLLNLPDPAPSLRDDPRYSVRLANQDTWEPETGYNQLNAILTVGGTADTPPVSVPTGEDVIIYNTNGSEDESAWTVVEDTPNNLDPTHMVLQNGLIRITYPALRGQPGTTGFTGNEKAAHLLHLKQGTEYVLAQDGDFGDWIYVGGSFTDDPTGFKIVENTSDRCKIVLEFDNHRMSAEDNSLNPCKKYVTLQKGHYGYTVFMEVEKASFGEYEAGFGGSASHLFTYSDRYGRHHRPRPAGNGCRGATARGRPCRGAQGPRAKAPLRGLPQALTLSEPYAKAPAPMSTASPAANSPVTYGGVAKTFHWLTALSIFALIPLGLIANDWSYDSAAALATKGTLFSLHKTLGVTLFFVALARIAWAVTQPKPGLLHPDRKLESLAAETTHWLLYASLVIVPLSGWINHAASQGFAPIWWPFSQTLPLVPRSEAVAGFFGAWREVFTKVLAAAVLLHVAGALKHHFVDKDQTLARMLPGRTAPEVPAQTHDRRPIWAATGIWAAAIALGTVLGLMGEPAEAVRAPGAGLAEVTSDWVVEDGSVSISVEQFGSAVQGSFADWTAAIAFDPEATGDVLGDVRAEIAVDSLTLGSVTSDALGAEFFDAARFPTAVFAGDIRAAEGENAYVAEGTLSMKGAEVPLTLPFTLTLDGGTATMDGRVTLDRREYGIGTASYQDGSTVGHDVAVDIALTARRAAQ